MCAFLNRPAAWMSFLLLLFSACDWLDRPEPLPAYLDLRPARVSLSPGSAASPLGIKDLWVDHNGVFQGAYRLPSVVPLLPSGDNRLTFSGGVFLSGLSAARTRYPFWVPITMTLGELAALDTMPLALTFAYYPDTVLAYPFTEFFEDVAPGIEATGGDFFAPLTRARETPYEGTFSGKVSFSPAQYRFEALSVNFTALPQRGENDIYLEITYRNNIPFTAGLYYVTPGALDVGKIPAQAFFNSNMAWNTVYIRLNEQVRSLENGAQFKVYIEADSRGEDGQARSGLLYLDQIRLVHFR